MHAESTSLAAGPGDRVDAPSVPRDAPDGQRRRRRVGLRSRLDRAILIEFALLLGLTAFSIPASDRLALSNGSLDVALNTLAALAAAAAAALAWVRYRVDGDVAAVFASAAFLVQCTSRALIVVIAGLGRADQLGMTVESAQQWPLYAWSLSRLLSAVLLVVAADTSLRGRTRTHLAPWMLVAAPSVLLLALFAMLRAIEPLLPPLISPAAIEALRGQPGGRAGMEPLGLAAQALIGVAYVRGAQLYRRVHVRTGQWYAAWMALALLIAAVSQVHWALFPGIYRPLVTIDDMLRAAFSVVLLLAIEAQSRADLAALRAANVRLRALHAADVDRAALEARARVARDVHDGLSQELWVAKLKQVRLSRAPRLTPEGRELVREMGDAIDRALADARAVVETLRGAAPARNLHDAVREVVADFEARTGIRTEVQHDADLPEVADVTASELLRIVREALTNVRKHADATLVRVAMHVTDTRGTIEVTVSDNGRGFDPATPTGSFGLEGMRERAHLIDGTVEISSRHADGTRVLIRVPASRDPSREATS